MSTPHTLIELSIKSYHKMKDHMIELGRNSIGACDKTPVLWYENFKLGKNVRTIKKKGANMPFNGYLKEIKMNEMKGKYLAITCNKLDTSNNSNVFLVNNYAAKEGEVRINKSGKVLLFYCVDDSQRNITGW